MSTLNKNVGIRDSLVHCVDSIVQGMFDQVVDLRHSFHHEPELTWSEHQTAKKIAAELRKIPGIQVKEGVGKLGVVGLLSGAKPGPTVALRADMDALPLKEQTTVAYASRFEGVHHGCGHDGHMACLLGAARGLSALRHLLSGQVKFIFQPAEEGGSGALAMIDDGVLKAPDVDVIFGLHGWPELPLGKIGCRAGPLMAATAEFSINVKGKGVHAAQPHLGVDPVLISAQMIQAFQAIPSRLVDPTDSVVVSVTKIAGGCNLNVIPGEVFLGGTIRAVKDETLRMSANKVGEIAQSVAQMNGAEVEVELCISDPVTYNHQIPAGFVKYVASSSLGPNAFEGLKAPSMTGEDFSHYLKCVPGAFFFLGLKEQPEESFFPLHHPKFNFQDKSLVNGIKMMMLLPLLWGKEVGKV